MARRATLTPYSRRLTPVEVAKLWFRRGADFGDQIHGTYPDFPKPGPDGLYLLSSVENWFDRFHGIKRTGDTVADEERDALMAAARGQNRKPR